MLSRQMPARVQLDVDDCAYAMRALRAKWRETRAEPDEDYWNGAHDMLEALVHNRIDTQADLIDLLEKKKESATILNHHDD